MSDPSKIPEEVKKQIDDALGLWVNNAGVEKTPGISMINKPVMQSTIDVKKSNLASDGISSSGSTGDGNSLVVRKNGGSKDGISASNGMSGISGISGISSNNGISGIDGNNGNEGNKRKKVMARFPIGNKTAAFMHLKKSILKMKKSFSGLAHASTDAAVQQGFKFLHDSAAGIEDFLLEMSDFFEEANARQNFDRSAGQKGI